MLLSTAIGGIDPMKPDSEIEPQSSGQAQDLLLFLDSLGIEIPADVYSDNHWFNP